MDVLLGTINTFLACQEMIRDSVPTCGVLPPSLEAQKCASPFPALQHLWVSLGTGWDKALIIPLVSTPGTLCLVWLYRKGLGQGPEKEPRDGPRWGKAESPGFVQPGEKNIITHSGLAAEMEMPLDRRDEG